MDNWPQRELSTDPKAASTYLLYDHVSTHGRVWLDSLKEDGRDSDDWIYLAQDRDQWQALVNMIMNHQVA
jgi:hypothetical protein